MPYTKQNWVDEIPDSSPVKYEIVGDVEGTITDSGTIQTVTPITPGSPVNASRLNYMEEGIETAQETAEAAAADSIPKSLVTAIGQLIYSTASGVVAALAKPTTFTGFLINTAAGALSWRQVKQTIQIQVNYETEEVDSTVSIAYFYVPSTMDGMNLLRAIPFVATAGVTNPTTIQVRNLTKYASNDSLSSAMSIASGATIGTAGTVDAARDDVSTNDRIKVYVTAQSTTKPKGLWVVLEFGLP